MSVPFFMIADTSQFCETDYKKMKKSISEERKIRIQKFVFDIDKKMSILSEFLLKKAIRISLQKEFQLYKDNHGKPFLKSSNCNYVYCGISHSNGLILIGYSPTIDLGVDIQNDLNDESFKSAECFSDKEQLDIKNNKINPYALWSMKEAVSKLLGFGLYLDFKQINFKQIDRQHYLTVLNNKVIYTFYTTYNSAYGINYCAISTYQKLKSILIHIYNPE